MRIVRMALDYRVNYARLAESAVCRRERSSSVTPSIMTGNVAMSPAETTSKFDLQLRRFNGDVVVHVLSRRGDVRVVTIT